MVCSTWPPFNSWVVDPCKITHQFDDLYERDSRDLDHPPTDYHPDNNNLNNIQGVLTRKDDTPDYKVWELTINAPPKACLIGMDCTTDWRAPYCNA